MANAGLHKRALTTKVLSILDDAKGPVPWIVIDSVLQISDRIKPGKSAKRTMMSLLSRGLINMVPGKGLEITCEGRQSYAYVIGGVVKAQAVASRAMTMSDIIRQHPEWAELPIGVNQGRGTLDLLGDRASVEVMDMEKLKVLVFSGNFK